MLLKLTAFFVSLAACLAANAQQAMGAKLFDSTDFVSAAQEAVEVDASESKILRHMRSQSAQIKSVQVTRIHRASLGSNVIKLQTPDGVQRQYIRNPPAYRPPQPELVVPPDASASAAAPMEAPPPRATIWSGTSQSNGVLTIAFTGDGALSGQLVDSGKFFRFDAMPGRKGFVLVTEIDRTQHQRE
jgi:hypothetical protein